MRRSLSSWLSLAFLCAFGAMLPLHAGAQSYPRAELGLNYTFVHTNAPPSGCGCFSMNGGSAWAGYRLTPTWTAVAEIGTQTATNISPTGSDLTLTSYLFGPRYTLQGNTHWKPFAQALFGGSHASGSLAPGNSGLPGQPNAFAMATGGGIDLAMSRHWALRPAELDYFFTHFDNGVNNHQNNIRYNGGIVFRF